MNVDLVVNVSFVQDRDTLLDESVEHRAYVKHLDPAVYVVEPTETKPHAAILFLHGICDHAFRYFPAAVHWARHGYQVLLLNMDGHGAGWDRTNAVAWYAREYLCATNIAQLVLRIRSRQKSDAHIFEAIRRENLERLRRIRAEDYLMQIEAVVSALCSPPSSESSVPVFLAGHSLGGLLAAEAGRRLSAKGLGKPAGVVLFSPAFQPHGRPGLEAIMVSMSWASRRHPIALAPLRAIMRCVAGLGLTANGAWGSKYVSDLPEERELQGVDPLILYSVPLSLLASIEKVMSQMTNTGDTYPVDVILLVSSQDQIVDPRGAVAFGKAVQKSRGSQRNTLVVYESPPCHELLRSSKRNEVLGEVENWLAARLSR